MATPETLTPAAAPTPHEVSRNALVRLPFDVKQRLRDLPQHIHALQSILATTDEDHYVHVTERADVHTLTELVYPLERAFDIIDRYVCELAATAVHRVGVAPGDPDENLRALSTLGATSRRRAQSLLAIHAARQCLDHPYDTEQRRHFAQAAAVLGREIVPFLSDYTSWFIALPEEPETLRLAPRR